MDAYKGFQVSGLQVKILYDPEPSSPREWDNLGTMVCWHSRYNLGDKHEFKYPADFREFWEDKTNDIAICLPLYLYDHSGITMSCSAFQCPWDSGQVGYIYITRAKIRAEYSAKRITKKLLERISGYLVNEVSAYDDFLTGNVYGYTIESSDGTVEESCWGFYGDPEECEKEARGIAEAIAKTRDEENSKIERMENNCYAL